MTRQIRLVAGTLSARTVRISAGLPRCGPARRANFGVPGFTPRPARRRPYLRVLKDRLRPTSSSSRIGHAVEPPTTRHRLGQIASIRRGGLLVRHGRGFVTSRHELMMRDATRA